MLAGRYDILAVIGGGGMGLVYKARHVMMNRIVAIKMLHPHLTNSSDALKRFQLEAQAASCLSLPNILTIYDFGVTDDDQPYMVMDYLEGTSLADVLEKERRLTVLRALNIFIQGCAGLAHAHQKGVLHRDSSPAISCLSITARDQADFVKIVDFGIAKLLNRTGDNAGNLTRTGEVYGSPLYMSPEQCRGQELDQRSDLYSFGCVMYKTLTGLPVFTGNEVIELLFKQVSEMPLRFAEACPDAYLPSELEEIVFKSLAKNPDHRFSSMSDLKDTLEAYKKRLEEPEENGNGKTPAIAGRASAPSTAMGPLAASLAAKSHGAAVTSTAKSATNHAPVAHKPAPPTPTIPPAASIENHATAPLPASHTPEPRAVQMHSANTMPMPSPEEAPFSALMKVASESVKPHGADMHAPAPQAAESAVPPNHPSLLRGKTKPEWLIILESTFANRLVLISVAGLIVAAVAVAIMAINAERAGHKTLAPATVAPATATSDKANAAKDAQAAAAHKTSIQGTKPQTTAQADPSADAPSGKLPHHHSRPHGGHGPRRHAYSSYGF